MSKLLRFEFHKLFRQKSFYICTALLLVIICKRSPRLTRSYSTA